MLGYGIGLRSVHYDYVLRNRPAGVDWFELITENYLAPGGRPRSILREVRANYPVVLHGLSFNIGTDEAPDWDYLAQLKALIAETEPEWVSDHLCWTGINGLSSHDLLPISYNEQPEFLNALVTRTGCEILLDVNNVYVSAFNMGQDPYAYVDALNPSAIRQFHLAGHTNNTTHIIDTHDHPVCDEVWKLYEYACTRFGPVATLLERDDHIPEFPELLEELQQARDLQEKALANRKPTAAQRDAS
mgnify:CR=1 FL=1